MYPKIKITPRFKTSKAMMLVGKRLTMSFANYKVVELWKSFMPQRNLIPNKLTNDLISLAIYKPAHFAYFQPTNEFERWVAVEVANFDNVPDEMETLIVPAGLYAIFDYKGLSSDNSIFQYIYGIWLPNSDYKLDNRPHFEVLGEKYKNNDPTSEEEIWIPVSLK